MGSLRSETKFVGTMFVQCLFAQMLLNTAFVLGTDNVLCRNSTEWLIGSNSDTNGNINFDFDNCEMTVQSPNDTTMIVNNSQDWVDYQISLNFQTNFMNNTKPKSIGILFRGNYELNANRKNSQFYRLRISH